MAFGKSGRPPEDPLLRQREIYEAVAPLILDIGVRRLSMRVAARAACLSVGGLYHHFPTKHDLVLHGLQPKAISRYCQDFHDRYGDLAASDPVAYLGTYLDFITDSIEFIRPAVHAAVELGLEILENILEPTLTAANAEFTAKFSAAFPDAKADDVYQMGRAIHRAIVSALFDKTITAQEFRREISALINGYSVSGKAASATSVTGMVLSTQHIS
jgi:AcrR family transcriptional regulator